MLFLTPKNIIKKSLLIRQPMQLKSYLNYDKMRLLYRLLKVNLT